MVSWCLVLMSHLTLVWNDVMIHEILQGPGRNNFRFIQKNLGNLLAHTQYCNAFLSTFLFILLFRVFSFDFTTFPWFHTPETLCYRSQSFFHLAVWLSFLSVWLTAPVRLWAWPAGTSNHSGHLGGPNVTGFHPSLPAGRLQRDGGKRHRGRGVFHLSVRSSVSPSTFSSADTYNWAHHQFYSSCLRASLFWVVWRPLSVPRAERVHALTQTQSPAPDCFLLLCAATFWRLQYHTEFYLDTIHRQPNESKSAQGKSKGRSDTDCPAHTRKINAGTQLLSLRFRQDIPPSGSKVLKALLLFLLFGYTIQLLIPTNLNVLSVSFKKKQLTEK